MERGFTLLEVAIAVVVVSFLLAGLLGPLSMRIEQQERRGTSDRLDEIKEALYGYAMDKGQLPCPDTNRDGVADASGAPPTCTDVEGWLPYVDLGVARSDAWGFLFRYRVTAAFATQDVDDICDGDDLDLCATGDMTVRTREPDDRTPPNPNLASSVPAMVLSYGKNGYGAIRSDGSSIPVPQSLWGSTVADEEENTNDDIIFRSRHYSFEPPSDPVCDDEDPDAPFCEYDDIVVWLSASVLKYRLVQAGKLP